MGERLKTLEEARCLLRTAIDSSRYKGNVAALTWHLFRGRRGKDFIRDFLVGRKDKLGGAAETAMVENALKLLPGTLAVAIEETEEKWPSDVPATIPLHIIEEAMKVVAYLIDPQHHWRDEHFRLAGQLFQESLSDKQSLGEDPETRRLRLEVAIRRALQKETL